MIDYVVIYQAQKNAAIGRWGAHVTPGFDGMPVPRITVVAGAQLVAWWHRQLLEGVELLQARGAPPLATTISEFGDLADQLVSVDLDAIPDSLAESSGLPYGTLKTEPAVKIWNAIGRVAIKLNSVGVVPSLASVAVSSLEESIREAPDLIGNVLGSAVAVTLDAAGRGVGSFVGTILSSPVVLVGLLLGALYLWRRT